MHELLSHALRDRTDARTIASWTSVGFPISSKNEPPWRYCCSVPWLCAVGELVGQGRMLLSSAHVLRAGGWEDEAREALLAAIEVNDRKGNVVTAGKARALLADLDPVAS